MTSSCPRAGTKPVLGLVLRRAVHAAGNTEHVTGEVISRQQLPTLAHLASGPLIESGRMERFGRFAGYCFY
jgi:hypothetical protein